MPYTPLAEPFAISFLKDDVKHEATVTYVKAEKCCANFFNVVMHMPEETPAFLLKEKPGVDPENQSMVWMDEYEKINMLYQYIGNEIDKHLRNDMGVFLIDAPLQSKEKDALNPDIFE